MSRARREVSSDHEGRDVVFGDGAVCTLCLLIIDGQGNGFERFFDFEVAALGQALSDALAAHLRLESELQCPL